MMTRRIFMGAVAAVTATAAAGFGSGRAFVMRRRLAMSEITPSVLDAWHNREVCLRRADGHTLNAVLKEADSVKYPARFSVPATEQVSLVFATEGNEAEEGTYRVAGLDLDLGDLYLTAIDGTGRDRRLEAVITRIV